jgi:alpha-galactosidase
MIADGAVTDPDAAARLTDDLIAGQLEHLPRFQS